MHSTSAEGSNSPRRGASSDEEDLPLLPGLLVDKLSMRNQTYYCHPEPKRVTNTIVGTVAEDPSMGPLQAKTNPSLGDKELKQVNSCITKNIVKTREQLNFLNKPNCKLNGYHRPISLTKRSRTELPASVPNKQLHIRNDSLEMERCSTNMPKSSEIISRERDVLISGNHTNYMPKQLRYMLGSGRDESLLKHPCRTIQAGLETWEYTKMTGRRSEMMPDVSIQAVAKMFDGGRDYKPDIQQRPSTESYLRPSESHCFRSKTEKNCSLAAFSESMDSGAADLCKNLIKKQGDTDVRIAPVSQYVGSLGTLSLKAKTLIKEEGGDDLQWPGISRRTSTLLRINDPLTGKLENPAITRRPRSTRLRTCEVASKTIQRPIKKNLFGQKPVSQPRCPMNSGLSDLTGDLDDCKLEAVNASNNASDAACSGPLWELMEPFLASLTQADPDFFKHLVTS